VRSRELPIRQVPQVEVDLAQRLRVTAARLVAMPADLASSISLTADRQRYGEADVRRLAVAIASPDHLSWAIEADGDVVTVTFGRPQGGGA
jgi:hypothetical protein